jgi:hypothetical protein
VSSPERALEQARREAARMRAAGAYAELPDAPEPEGAPPAAGPLSLYRWGQIEPDLAEVRSTRRLGAPVTALKRALLRLLLQYHVQLTAQQTRFNLALLTHIDRLQERVAQLERAMAESERAPAERDPS